MNIEVSIERIVLDGLIVQGRDGDKVRAAVQSELTRLLREGGIAPSLTPAGATARLDAPSIQIPAGVQPVALGHKIAHAIYGGIGT
jgi:hypothetical protein